MATPPPSPYPSSYRPMAYPLPPLKAPHRKPSLLRDIYNGAVVGDFAREMRLPGALTQMAIGYTPGLGTLCASRDLVADLRHHDHLGAALNALAVFPVFGGFPKTAAVLRHLHLIGRAVIKSGHRADQR